VLALDVLVLIRPLLVHLYAVLHLLVLTIVVLDLFVQLVPNPLLYALVAEDYILLFSAVPVLGDRLFPAHKVMFFEL
jgi:hypothetical protein